MLRTMRFALWPVCPSHVRSTLHSNFVGEADSNPYLPLSSGCRRCQSPILKPARLFGRTRKLVA